MDSLASLPDLLLRGLEISVVTSVVLVNFASAISYISQDINEIQYFDRLYGITYMQIIMYYRNYWDDKSSFKIMVRIYKQILSRIQADFLRSTFTFEGCHFMVANIQSTFE